MYLYFCVYMQSCHVYCLTSQSFITSMSTWGEQKRELTFLSDKTHVRSQFHYSFSFTQTSSSILQGTGCRKKVYLLKLRLCCNLNPGLSLYRTHTRVRKKVYPHAAAAVQPRARYSIIRCSIFQQSANIKLNVLYARKIIKYLQSSNVMILMK